MRTPPSASAIDGEAPAGDFEAIVLTHHDEIHRYLRRVTGRTGEAEDLAQETFLRAYRGFDRLPLRMNHRAWLYTIATNAYRNHLRSKRRSETAHATLRVTRRETDTHGPETAALADEIRTFVAAAIQRLPLKQRLAFTMRKLEDLDYESIGASLGCSPEAARAHVFQALRKIRRVLDGTS